MTRFARYLAGQANIAARYVPHYRNWVVRFYEQIAKPPDYHFSGEEKTGFLREMATQHEEWQVHQADHALRCVCHRTLNTEHRSPNTYRPESRRRGDRCPPCLSVRPTNDKKCRGSSLSACSACSVGQSSLLQTTKNVVCGRNALQCVTGSVSPVAL
jgi:hypothetical protein